MFCLLKGSDKHPEDADRLREENYTVKAKLDEVWLELEKEGEWLNEIWLELKKEGEWVIWGMTRIREKRGSGYMKYG